MLHKLSSSGYTNIGKKIVGTAISKLLLQSHDIFNFPTFPSKFVDHLSKDNQLHINFAQHLIRSQIQSEHFFSNSNYELVIYATTLTSFLR
jgi:hypothetical protein